MALYDTSGTTWTQWTSNTATTCPVDTDSTWGGWVIKCSSGSGATTVSTGSGGAVWIQWNTGDSATATAATVRCHPAAYVPPVLTDEQQRQRAEEYQRQQEAYRVRYEKETQERAAANTRAEELLVENLTLNQRRLFRKRGHFYVRGKSGRHYRLKPGWSGNVEEVNKAGKALNRFCIHPGEYVPDADNVLAQKLLLEADEETFLKTANRTACPN